MEIGVPRMTPSSVHEPLTTLSPSSSTFRARKRYSLVPCIAHVEESGDETKEKACSGVGSWGGGGWGGGGWSP